MLCLHICQYITYMPGAHGDQKRSLDALDLELQTSMRHSVGLGAEPWSSAEP